MDKRNKVNEERRYFIYKHTTPSGKVYIGKTGQKDPKMRWANGNGYKENVYFNSAIKKHGWENISHEILEENLTQEEAYWSEIKYIKEYDSFNREHGYNLTKGGDGGLGTHLSEDQIRMLNQAAREKCTGLYLGEKSVKARGCIQYDKDGFLIKRWGSISDASRALGCHFSDIIRACRGKTRTCADYIWTYDDEEYLLPYRIRELHRTRHWTTVNGVRTWDYTYE